MVSHAPFHPHTPSSGTVFLVLGMHKVLLCLSLVSLSLHPGGIPRHQARPSPSRNGGKLIANTTEKPNFGCCVLGPCFLHRCVSCNTSCRWVFQTKTRKKKGHPPVSIPTRRTSLWLFSSQAAAHSPPLLSLLSHTGALHLRNNRGTLRHRPT